MRLEIHKAGDQAPDVHVEVNEVFPEHYDGPERAAVYEGEARALYEALKDALPKETRAELTRLLRLADPRRGVDIQEGAG